MSLTPSTNQLPTAFRIVRQILSNSSAAEGLTTKELVKEALKLYQSENPNSSSSSIASSSSSSSQQESINVKGKGKNVVTSTKKDKGINVIPDGHPFISTSYLKSRILSRLESQDLLIKVPKKTQTSSTSSSSISSNSTSSSSSGTGSGGGKQIFVWKINEPKQSNLNTPKWNFPEHWNKLIEGTSTPGQLYFEYQQNLIARKEEEKQRGLDSGKVLRTEKQIWENENRLPILTTNLERLHLNKRKSLSRPKKERKRLELFQSVPLINEGQSTSTAQAA
ncbi:uncharacterized protein L201_004073 [Kwoniella dendrophila CBS 6074]|uniref:Transcription initiation factor IIE subunit beta n=1 Tax=Kwoniella dendrophila CBS 6074 TaxID=1295534 RepID=A0AAX4JUP4_9TREE